MAKKAPVDEVPCSAGLVDSLANATKELADAAIAYDELRDGDLLEELMEAALRYAKVRKELTAKTFEGN
jgi:hypothetical protein